MATWNLGSRLRSYAGPPGSDPYGFELGLWPRDALVTEKEVPEGESQARCVWGGLQVQMGWGLVASGPWLCSFRLFPGALASVPPVSPTLSELLPPPHTPLPTSKLTKPLLPPPTQGSHQPAS